MLQFVRNRSQVQRALTVLKTRASLHEPETRQYVITAGGIVVGDAFPGEVDVD